MSTPALVLFSAAKADGPDSAVYIHWDGGPDTMTSRFNTFLDEVEKQTSDTRFNDPAYLAAKFIVRIAGQMTSDKDKPLAFTGVAPAMPTDTDLGQCFTYAVLCDLAAWPPARPEFRKLDS